MDSYTQSQYQRFINIISNRINAHFEEQKEYIHCKEGCSLCCQRGEYPCTQAEFEYLVIGFSYLPEETQNIILNNIEKIKNEKINFKGEKFSHACPFLIDNRCSVYEYRMVVCRTFGLIYYNDTKAITGENPMQIPFCVEEGLNYSEVFDKEKNTLTSEKVKENGFSKDPVGFNLNFNQLRNKVGYEMLDINFGEEKPLIEWL